MERSEDGTRGLVELDLSETLDIFKGHFPGDPIFPGVLQVEAAAQACGWTFLGVLPKGATPPVVRFVGIDDFRFKKPVVPPATIRFECSQKRIMSKLQLWDVSILVDKTVVGKGSFWLYLDLSGDKGKTA